MPRLPGLLLACLLLWAQLAGAAHALEHLQEDADEPPACAWCLAFANVQHGAAGKSAAALPALGGVQPAAITTHNTPLPFSPAYRSRGPPHPPV